MNKKALTLRTLNISRISDVKPVPLVVSHLLGGDGVPGEIAIGADEREALWADTCSDVRLRLYNEERQGQCRTNSVPAYVFCRTNNQDGER